LVSWERCSRFKAEVTGTCGYFNPFINAAPPPHAALPELRTPAGHKAYSNRKVGRMAADLCLSSKKNERLVVTTERLDGEALTV
jgi:hypothetical protein